MCMHVPRVDPLMKIYIRPLHVSHENWSTTRCFSSADLYTVSINIRKSLWVAAQPLSLLYKENKTRSNLSQSTASSALRFFGCPPSLLLLLLLRKSGEMSEMQSVSKISVCSQPNHILFCSSLQEEAGVTQRHKLLRQSSQLTEAFL